MKSAETYFWCTSTEDGTHIEPLTEAELTERLKEVAEGEWSADFLDKVPDSDKGYWMDVGDSPVVIIKGAIVVPKATKRVTEYVI